MKKFILPVVLLVLLLVAGGETANAQNEIRLSSTPKAFQTFYAKFRNAALKGDKKNVASLTHFPFGFQYVEEGDSGTLSKAQFIKKYNRFFSGEKKVFAQKNPVFYTSAEAYNLNDDWNAIVYTFEKKGTSYKFVAYIALP